jgi:uncharacterized protein (TIGR04255 family)
VAPLTIPSSSDRITADQLPRKLREDAIIEAIVELRFETPTLFEVLLGRIADHEYWRAFTQTQLAAYQIPSQLRELDPAVRYAPLFQLADQHANAVLNIGPSVLSFHQRAPYPGWRDFREAIERALESLFAAAREISVIRLGLRYLNALTFEKHAIRSLTDLNMQLLVGKAIIADNANINFKTAVENGSSCLVRVATKDFVQGALPPDTRIYVDVDVSTEEGFRANDHAKVGDWIDRAHTAEKLAFFSLFTKNQIDKLKED